MGFSARRTFKLVFEDGDLEGLEVRARSVTVGQSLAMADFDPADKESAGKLIELFVGCLVQWNLEDDEGNHVAETLDGFRSVDQDLGLSIAKAWQEHVAGSVDAPLAVPSPDGELSAVPSIPMETLSESHAS